LRVLVWVTQNRGPGLSLISRTQPEFVLEEPVVEQEDSGFHLRVFGTKIGTIVIYCFRTPKQEEVLHKH
jgi:hypothetical protein